MYDKDYLYGDLYRGFLKRFSELKDIERSVGYVMYKYGEYIKGKGLSCDDGGMSFVDKMSVGTSGVEEEERYRRGVRGNGGGVEGVLEYLYNRFSYLFIDDYGNEVIKVDVIMIDKVLCKARELEGVGF